MAELDLRKGEEYQIGTFYNFKIGTYPGRFLGNIQFRNESRAVFKRTKEVPMDNEEYLFLILDDKRSKPDSKTVYSKIDDDYFEDSEIVLVKDTQGLRGNWAFLREGEQDKLVELLKELGEKITCL